MLPRSSSSDAVAASAVCECLESRWLLAASITELQLATGSNPEKVVVGHDGSVYVYEQGTEKLARLRPGKTTFQEVDIPSASNQHFGMTVSKKGDIFFTVNGG